MSLAYHAACDFLKQAGDNGMDERHASGEQETGGEPSEKAHILKIGLINGVGVIDKNSVPGAGHARDTCRGQLSALGLIIIKLHKIYYGKFPISETPS